MSVSHRTEASSIEASGTRRNEAWYVLPGVALLLCFLALSAFFVHSEWRKLLDEVETTSVTVTRILAEHADRLLEKADFARSRVAEIVDDVDTFEFDRPHHEQLVQLVRLSPHLTSIWVGDAEGMAALTSRAYPAPALSAADRDYFTIVRDDPDAFFIGNLVDNRYIDEVLINTSRRLPSEDGQFHGFVQVSLNPYLLRQTFRQALLPYQASLWLIAPNGQPLMREPFIAHETMIQAVPSLTGTAEQGSGYFVTTSGVDGADRRFYYSRSPQYGVYAMVGVDEAAMSSIWWGRVMPILVFSGLFLAAMVAILIFVRRQRLIGLQYAEELEQEVQDRTRELHRTSQERELLLQELRHRVRNAFTTINALAQQMLRSSTDLEALKRDFPQRLSAMAATQILLVESEDRESASLQDLVWAELQPYRARTDEQIEVQGPPMTLSAQQVTAVGLALHELTTNAVKYGALSVPEGKLHISWRCEADKVLVLQWMEHGGPPVTPPTERGFGSQMMERSAKLFGGEIDFTYAPTGLQAEMRLPL